MRVPEAMSLLGYDSRPGFYTFVKTAGVPHYRLNGRNLRFDRQQLKDWLNSRFKGQRFQ